MSFIVPHLEVHLNKLFPFSDFNPNASRSRITFSPLEREASRFFLNFAVKREKERSEKGRRVGGREIGD